MNWFAQLFSRLRNNAADTPKPTPSTVTPAMTPPKNPHAAEYRRLWDTMKTDKGKEGVVADRVNAIAKGRSRYEGITAKTGVPWEVIGIIHNMECGLDFSKHLHNGDSLNKRTWQVPKGRPVAGNPPFTFEESAVDALQYDGLTKWVDWSIEGTLLKLEGYNGFGYRNVRNKDGTRGTDNPYLWAFSNHCDEIGKFVQDGRFDPHAVTKQIGVALLLKGLRGL